MSPFDIPEWLAVEIVSALEGDSNDAEHDALVAVAEYVGLRYRDFDDLDDEELAS